MLFVCVHNAGRSQMAEALLNKLASSRHLAICGTSAGTVGGKTLNPAAVEVMREIGIDMSTQTSKALTREMIEQADKVITMGCGVESKACPANYYVTEDWGLDDPAGQPLEAVRAIRDQIKARVEQLIEAMA